MQVMIDFKKCEKLKAKSEYMKTYYKNNRPARLTYQQQYDKLHRAEHARRERLRRAKKKTANRVAQTIDEIHQGVCDLQDQMQVVMDFLHRIEKGQSHC